MIILFFTALAGSTIFSLWPVPVLRSAPALFPGPLQVSPYCTSRRMLGGVRRRVWPLWVLLLHAEPACTGTCARQMLGARPRCAAGLAARGLTQTHGQGVRARHSTRVVLGGMGQQRRNTRREPKKRRATLDINTCSRRGQCASPRQCRSRRDMHNDARMIAGNRTNDRQRQGARARAQRRQR